MTLFKAACGMTAKASVLLEVQSVRMGWSQPGKHSASQRTSKTERRHRTGGKTRKRTRDSGEELRGGASDKCSPNVLPE